MNNKLPMVDCMHIIWKHTSFSHSIDPFYILNAPARAYTHKWPKTGPIGLYLQFDDTNGPI